MEIRDEQTAVEQLAHTNGWRREPGSVFRGRCPLKDHKTQSTLPMVISVGSKGRAIAYCHACRGNGTALLAHFGLMPERGAQPAAPPVPPAGPKASSEEELARRIEKAGSIFRHLDPCSEQLAAGRWLRGKCKLPGELIPCIPARSRGNTIAFVYTPIDQVFARTWQDMEHNGIHMRYFDSKGSPALNKEGLGKKNLGPMKGCVTLLLPPGMAAVPSGSWLAVCEGITDGLALYGLFFREMQASGKGSGIPVLVPHGTAGVEHITIPPSYSVMFFSDRDEAGQTAAFVGARRHAKNGGQVRVLIPRDPNCKDPNAAVVVGKSVAELFLFLKKETHAK